MPVKPDLDTYAVMVFLDAVKDAVTLAAPSDASGAEVAFLRLARRRAALTSEAVNMVKEHGLGPAEVLAAAAWLREEVADLPPGQYEHSPLNS